MISKAELRYIRITPRKFRQVIPLIKGMNAEAALDMLVSVKKKAALYAIDLIKSALANSKRIQGIDTSTLYISNLVANCGPSLKRYRAASMGRASTILKRTSHLIIELDKSKDAPAAPKGAEAKVKKEIKEEAKTIKTKTKPTAKKAK